MTPPRDRRDALTRQTDLNGIDFVEIADATQTVLRVHFINPAPGADLLRPSVTAVTIAGGESIPTVKASVVQWTTPAAADGSPLPPVLTLAVAAPGDFSTYTLTVKSALLDLYFDHVPFSFKARCPSPFDCDPPPPACPPPPGDAPPIDYLAKDFQSFRKALLDFSALRYPAWQERSEADFGVMFAEALSSLADDLSYFQDRIAAEAWIETATQRRSLVRHARLVDYEPGVATAARVLLQLDVASRGSIPSGLAVGALSPDGAPVVFETGAGMADPVTSRTADPAWNRGQLPPYWWDDGDRCLARGATEVWVEGRGLGLTDGQMILIDTAAEVDADAPVREVVRLVVPAGGLEEEHDPIFDKQLTRLVWRAEDALRFDHDLTRTVIAGNLVPATQGQRFTETFTTTTAWPAALPVPRALVRTGANGTVQFLHTLSNAPLAWLAQDDPGAAPQPEIQVVQLSGAQRLAWTWQRTLLDANGFDGAFTLDPARYRAVTAPATGIGMADYDGDDGDTIRFGDGVFGPIPDDGASFEVTYRVGGGTRGNVAADTITRLDTSDPRAGLVLAVTNPFAAQGGADAEPADRVREMAPQAFRATQLRAVRPEDYQQAAETLPWVQRAGTAFRYTGSWLSVFTAVDPLAMGASPPNPGGAESVPAGQMAELVELLDRCRLAGYESHARGPRYASLDVAITVCARPDAFRGDVESAVLAALDSSMHADGTKGFFHPDRFTFGTPLDRSALEAAIQDLPGVDGVVAVRYRRRGFTHGFVAMPDTVAVALDEVLRVEGDPSRPDRGSLSVSVRGGK